MSVGDSGDGLARLRRTRDILRATRAELSVLHVEGVPDLAGKLELTPDPMQDVFRILAESRRELKFLDRLSTFGNM